MNVLNQLCAFIVMCSQIRLALGSKAFFSLIFSVSSRHQNPMGCIPCIMLGKAMTNSLALMSCTLGLENSNPPRHCSRWLTNILWCGFTEENERYAFRLFFQTRETILHMGIQPNKGDHPHKLKRIIHTKPHGNLVIFLYPS